MIAAFPSKIEPCRFRYPGELGAKNEAHRWIATEVFTKRLNDEGNHILHICGDAGERSATLFVDIDHKPEHITWEEVRARIARPTVETCNSKSGKPKGVIVVPWSRKKKGPIPREVAIATVKELYKNDPELISWIDWAGILLCHVNHRNVESVQKAIKESVPVWPTIPNRAGSKLVVNKVLKSKEGFSELEWKVLSVILSIRVPGDTVQLPMVDLAVTVGLDDPMESGRKKISRCLRNLSKRTYALGYGALLPLVDGTWSRSSGRKKGHAKTYSLTQVRKLKTIDVKEAPWNHTSSTPHLLKSYYGRFEQLVDGQTNKTLRKYAQKCVLSGMNLTDYKDSLLEIPGINGGRHKDRISMSIGYYKSFTRYLVSKQHTPTTTFKRTRIDSVRLTPKSKETHHVSGLRHSKAFKQQSPYQIFMKLIKYTKKTIDIGYLNWAIKKSGVILENPQGLLDFGIDNFLYQRGAPMDCYPMNPE